MSDQYGVLDGLADALSVHDAATGRLIFINRAGRGLFGLSDETPLEAVNFDDLIVGPDLGSERWLALLQEVANDGPKEQRWQSRRADGERFWVNISLSPAVSSGESVILVAARDVSESVGVKRALRRSERALEDANRMLQLVLDTIPVRVFWKDRESRYLGCNRLFASDAGKPDPAALIGKDDYAMGWASEADLYRADDRLVIDTGEAKINFEEHQTTPDGSTIWLRTSKLPLRDRSGQIIGVLGTYEDITEAHRLQEQLTQAQKMEAIGQLAGGVAHDFNNLLQAIVGYLDLCLLDHDLPSDVISNLDQIGTAAERAISLTGQMLAFSRRETMVREPVWPADLVASTAQLVDRVIGDHITVVTQIDPDLPAICIDRAQLEVSLLNLCINARDAMDRGGTLTIRARPGRDGAWLDQVTGNAEDFLALEVEDTGVGIPEEHRERVLEPFFTTKGVGEGTGLGLSTVYAVVERHGGTLELDSRPGRGTRIVLYLPVVSGDAPAQALSEEIVPGVQSDSRPACILLAEDDDLVRRLATTILRGAGYEVLVACDGTEAVALFKAAPDRVDLALLDVVMPGLSGREVRDVIRDARPHVPILLCSGYTREILEGSGLEAGSLLHKPYSAQVLIARVQQLLRR